MSQFGTLSVSPGCPVSVTYHLAVSDVANSHVRIGMVSARVRVRD